MKISSILFAAITLIMFNSCNVNNQSSASRHVNRSSGTTATSTVTPTNSSLSLFDYLRKVPGVQVSGTESNPNIMVRTSFNSSYSSNQPLFVIDGRPVGNNYQTAAGMVDVNDIKSITVLKDVASTSEYGMQGSNGVIVIRLKKGNDR
jgi:TonB-dependent SusC/RagA subfamily outer membrane receptor